MVMTKEQKNGLEMYDSKGPNKNKLLVIGIDGGTLDIILPMVNRGKLPNLGKLINTGAYGTLLSTIPPVTAPAWSSFITGTNPGKHGVFYFFKKGKEKQGKGGEKVLVNLRHIKGFPFWRALNQYGSKVGLINIPLTYPPEQVDRFMISGMLVPQGSDDYTYPPELLSKLENYYVDIDGLMVQNEWRGKKLIKENREMFIRNVFNLSKARAHNALKLMKSEPWDFFMVVFTGSDRICHFFWEDHNSGKSPSSIVEDYYIFLDSMIGRLVEEAGEDTCKLVMSDHGFGPAPTKRINAFVLAKHLKETVFTSCFPFFYLRNRFLAKIGMAKRIALEDFVDSKRSRISFEPIYANFLGISINTKGDDGYGIVRPGEEYQTLREEIIKRLESLSDPVSGKRLVEKVHTRESLYQGSFVSEAPDIVVQFSYDCKIGFSPLKRALVCDARDPIRTGEHRREGIFIASGSQITSGRLETELFIQDVTPTILYLLGVPIPESYDGRLIRELFSDEYLAQHHPQYDGTERQAGTDPDGPEVDSQKEFEESKKLLQNLGYM